MIKIVLFWIATLLAFLAGFTLGFGIWGAIVVGSLPPFGWIMVQRIRYVQEHTVFVEHRRKGK